MTTKTYKADKMTGFPVLPDPVSTPKVGDLCTFGVGSDSYPAVVVDVTSSGKTVWVRTVSGIHTKDTVVGYGHDPVEVIPDPEEVDRAVSDGRNGYNVKKFQRRKIKARIGNFREERETGLPVGTRVIKFGWSSKSGRLVLGKAISKQDPHV